MLKRLHHLVGSRIRFDVAKRYWALLRFGWRTLLSLYGGLLLSIGLAEAHAAEPGTAEEQAPVAGSALTPVPIEEAAARAAEASRLLTSLNKELAPGADIENVRRQLPDVDDRVALELDRTLNTLKAQPALETLRSEQESWRKRQEEITAWIDLFTRRAIRLQAVLGQLATLEAKWRLTLEKASSASVPSAVVRQIAAILPAIETAQLNFQKQYSTVLDLQGRVAEAAARCQSALSEVAFTQQAAMGRTATRERLPVWSADFWRLGKGGPGLVEIVGAPWADIRYYLADPGNGLPVHLGFLPHCPF